MSRGVSYLTSFFQSSLTYLFSGSNEAALYVALGSIPLNEALIRYFIGLKERQLLLEETNILVNLPKTKEFYSLDS